MYELALISVLIAAGYWGVYFVRHDSTRMYGVMQLASAGLAGLGLYAHKTDDAPRLLGLVGAIGVGGGTCLLVVGPMTRALARRMAAAERFRIAARLLDIAELLAPGSGVADEKELLAAMREIRDGNIEQTVESLTAAKDRVPAEARLAIDERIAMLYIAAYRWDEAIAHAEENLFGAVPPVSADPGTPTIALRRALGIAPPVWVELLGAYGYTGNLDQAARMLARLEEVCIGRADAAMWVHRGRMIFLALAGRVAAVETLVEPRRSRHMSRAARTYWVAVAHERKGDGPGAEAAYAKARSRSRGRPRVLIDQALARLSAGEASRPNIELGPAASELVALVEAQPPPEVVLRVRPRGPWATQLLAAGVLASAAAIAIAFGESSDIGVLLRAGALVHGFVHDGEWWRLVSCVFVHIGGLHLLVNTIGLWFVGRLCEDLFGPARTIAIFAVAGLAGAAASYVASQNAVMAGASGAIFGLLGAVFVELTWHRQRHRAAWSRGMWGIVVVVALAQVGIGSLYSTIDQWAHGGGLAFGSLMGFVLSPHAKWARPARFAARAIAIAFGIAVAASAVMVARTSVATSLARPNTVQLAIGDRLSAAAPASWVLTEDGVLRDADDIINLKAVRTPPGDLHELLAQWTTAEEKRAHDAPPNFDQIDVATEHLVPLSAEWQSNELVVSVEAADGNRQRYRVVVAGKPLGDGLVFASLYVPERVAREAAPFFTRLVDSIAAQ